MNRLEPGSTIYLVHSNKNNFLVVPPLIRWFKNLKGWFSIFENDWRDIADEGTGVYYTGGLEGA